MSLSSIVIYDVLILLLCVHAFDPVNRVITFHDFIQIAKHGAELFGHTLFNQVAFG